MGDKLNTMENLAGPEKKGWPEEIVKEVDLVFILTRYGYVLVEKKSVVMLGGQVTYHVTTVGGKVRAYIN